MKKQLLFTAMIAIGASAYAQFPQCSPANYPTNVGLSTHPDSGWVYPDALPDAEVGQPYYEVIYFKFQEHVTTEVGGSTIVLNLNSAEITGVTGLPSGFSRKSDKFPGTDIWNGGDIGCLAVYGTTFVPGTFSPVLNLEISVSSTNPPFSFVQDTMIDDYTINVLGASNILDKSSSNSNVSFYPNPANKNMKVMVQAKSSQSSILILRNLLGDEVLNVNWNLKDGENEKPIDVSILPEGVYIYSLLVDQKIVSGKITVAH